MFDNEEQGSQGNKLKEKKTVKYTFSNHFLCDLYDRNNKLARVK